MIRKIRELAKNYNISVEDILNETTLSSRPLLKPKYQHPTNPQLVWTGRGRAPNWVKQLMQSGLTKDTLRIPD